MKKKHVLKQDTLLYWLRQSNIEKKKKVFPFYLESPRPVSPSQGLWTPISSSGALDFLSAYLVIDSLSATVIYFFDNVPYRR